MISEREADAPPGLLAEAIEAANRGDVDSAQELAAELLRRDPGNRDARSLVDQDEWPPGELRQLTLMFCDVVGSTEMSRRVDLGTYRKVIGEYVRICGEVTEQHGGAICQRTGDGVLALFGHPRSHEDDTRRAVTAGLALLERIAAARPDIEAACGERLEARVAVHHGLVHLDLVESQVFGLAPNLAARLQDLAEPGTLVISDEVLGIVGRLFEVESQEPRILKGMDEPVRFHTVLRELPETPQRGRAWLPPFVGRVCEREQVAALLGDSDANAVVVVRGEPGIGKSRLVSEVVNDLDEGVIHRIFRFICSPEKKSMDFALAGSFLHLDDSTASPFDPSRRLQRLESDLETLGLHGGARVSLLAPLLRIKPEAGYDPVATDITKVHDQILTALRSWLEACGMLGPVLLLFEDVQWADSSSMELLSRLARHPIPEVQVLATERDDSARLAGRGVQVIHLEPLSNDEAAEMARLIDETAEPDQVVSAMERSEGNPFFLQELLLSSHREDRVDPEVVSRLEEDSGVPGILYEPLIARLYAPGIDVGLAQVAATIGHDFDTDVLTATARRPADAILRGLGALVDGGIVETDGHGADYSFRHSLIRDLAYELQPRNVRAKVHGRVGQALRDKRGSGAPVSWSVIAAHFDRAQRVDDAVLAYEAAADGARDRGALAQGREHLSAALDLLESAPPDRARRHREVDLRLKRGFLAVSVSGYADPTAVADYQTSLDLVTLQETSPEVHATLLSLWGYYTVKGELHRAQSIQDVMRRQGLDQRLQAEVTAGAGMIAFFRGNVTEAEHYLTEALATLPETADDRRPDHWELPNDAVTSMHVHCSAARWQQGDTGGFRDQMRRGLDRASRLPFPDGPFSTAYALSYQAWILEEIGELDSADQSASEMGAIGSEHGFDFWTITAALHGAVIAARRELASKNPDLNTIAQHAAILSGSTMAWKMVEARVLLPYAITALGEFQAAAGNPEEALRTFEESLEVSAETGAAFYDAETYRIRARVMRSLGLDGADQELDRARRLAHEQGSVPFETRALMDQQRLGLPVVDAAGLLDDRAALEAAGPSGPSTDAAPLR